MARRHDTLVPLTHDHHHALSQARRLEEAASFEGKQQLTATHDFLNFYFGRAVRHFHEEEELFFAPLVDHPEARDLVLRAVTEHLRMHALVQEVKRGLSRHDVPAEVLRQISALLTDHVRFEENELFPVIERLLPEEELRDLAAGRREI